MKIKKSPVHPQNLCSVKRSISIHFLDTEHPSHNEKLLGTQSFQADKAISKVLVVALFVIQGYSRQ